MKIILLLLAMCLVSNGLLAQWTLNGTYIYNTNTGNVGIGTGAATPSSKLEVHVGTTSTITSGFNVYRNSNPHLGVRLLTGTGDGAAYATWNGGLGSWFGIGFHSMQDGITRGVFNVRDGSFSLKGNINSEGSAVFNGNAIFGTNLNPPSMISGPAYSGAIQIKTNGNVGGTASRHLRLGMKDNNSVFYPVLSIADDLNVGIGTTLTTNPFNYKLAVNGTIGAKEVRVENSSTTWADYVFEPDYKLLPLELVEDFVKTNKHLPEIPSAEEVKINGHKLGEMDVLLLKKVEELTLYLIEIKKEVSQLKEENKELRSHLSNK